MIERCLLGGRRKILAAGQPQHSAKFKVPASVAKVSVARCQFQLSTADRGDVAQKNLSC